MPSLSVVPAPPRLRRIDWLAEVLDLSTAQTYDAIAKGHVPAECVTRIGRRLRVHEDRVLAWLGGESR